MDIFDINKFIIRNMTHSLACYYNLVQSQNGYCIWKWKFHSELAAAGFPFSNRNKMFNENVYPIPTHKINFR